MEDSYDFKIISSAKHTFFFHWTIGSSSVDAI